VADVSVFAIDPGETTGWCFYSSYDCTTGVTEIHHGFHIAKLLDEFTPDQVVIELMPQKMAQKISNIVFQCKEGVRLYLQKHPHYGYAEIAPGNWKPVMKREKLPFKMKTQHEKDAYRMARFWLYEVGAVPRPME